MSEWISVKDRLPEARVDVLICAGVEMCVGYFNYGFFYPSSAKTSYDMASSELDFECEVSHWMPLPEAPKDE